ncbi:MAG TPA: hypothetical protein PKH39_06860 [Woeseiaceae bacterium]|nr:hypothetical protein [Woeseiaceae bacterium]
MVVKKGRKMRVTLMVGTALFVLCRGYLYFTDHQDLAAMLDLALLPIYLLACIKDRRHIYVSLIAYLPASSIFYLPTGAIPFDLSMVIILLLTVTVSRELPKRKLSNAIKYALVLYAALCAYLSISLFVDLVAGLGEFHEQFKVLYYLFNAAAAGYLFTKVYDPRDRVHILSAIEVAVVAYVVASCVGYLFPLSTFTWQLDSGVQFKSLFRYPGMSNSNYVSHVLLVLVALHRFIARRGGVQPNLLSYVGVLSVIAIASQSRSFVVASIVLIATWWVLEMARNKAISSVRRVRVRGSRAILVAALIAMFVIVMFSEFFMVLGQQTFNRFSSDSRTTINISRRFDEWGGTFAYFAHSDRSMIRGNLYYPESLRPHNVILSAVLVFGVPIALVFVFLIIALALKHPLLIFLLLGIQAEILFATGLYDFLFFVILTVLCSRQNWTSEDLVILSASPFRVSNANAA